MPLAARQKSSAQRDLGGAELSGGQPGPVALGVLKQMPVWRELVAIGILLPAQDGRGWRTRDGPQIPRLTGPGPRQSGKLDPERRPARCPACRASALSATAVSRD